MRVTSAYPPTKRSRRSSRTASLPYPALCVKTNEAETSEGEADDWWYGYTRERCERIFSRSGFMGESHVHVIANLLQREIVVVDERTSLLSIMHYKLGYKVQKQISMREAKQGASRL